MVALTNVNLIVLGPDKAGLGTPVHHKRALLAVTPPGMQLGFGLGEGPMRAQCAPKLRTQIWPTILRGAK